MLQGGRNLSISSYAEWLFGLVPCKQPVETGESISLLWLLTSSECQYFFHVPQRVTQLVALIDFCLGCGPKRRLKGKWFVQMIILPFKADFIRLCVNKSLLRCPWKPWSVFLEQKKRRKKKNRKRVNRSNFVCGIPVPWWSVSTFDLCSGVIWWQFMSLTFSKDKLRQSSLALINSITSPCCPVCASSL